MNLVESRRVRAVPSKVPWKSVALPVEHGAWSFLLEPVILGLVLAPSASGLCIALAALAAFLTRHPLRLAVMDHRKGARYPRTALAERFALAYATLALVFAGAAFALVTGRPAEATFVVPILIAAPVALIALGLDLQGRGRELASELAGSVALGGSVAAIVLAAGGPARLASVAWLLLALRAVTAIVYVRARLQHERGARAPVAAVLGAHAIALFLVAVLAADGLAPPLAAVAFCVLLSRAAFGLLTEARRVRPQVVGLQEVALGVVTLVLLSLGFA